MKALLTNILLLISNLAFCQVNLDFYDVYCEDTFDDEKYTYIDRIIDTTWISDTLVINLTKFDNCGYLESTAGFDILSDTLYLSYEFLTHKEIRDGDTIEVSFINMCSCPLNLTYKMTGLEKKKYFIKLNNNHIEKSPDRFKKYSRKYDILEDGDTINIVDEYGLKQNYWLDFNKSLNQYLDGYYYNNEFVDGEKINYRDDGSIEFIMYYHSNDDKSCDSLRIDYYNENDSIYKTFRSIY